MPLQMCCPGPWIQQPLNLLGVCIAHVATCSPSSGGLTFRWMSSSIHLSAVAPALSTHCVLDMGCYVGVVVTGEGSVQGRCVHGTAVLDSQLAAGQLCTCTSVVSVPGDGLAGYQPMGGGHGRWQADHTAWRMATATSPVADECILCDVLVCLDSLRALLGVAMVECAWPVPAAEGHIVTVCEHLPTHH